MRGSWGVGGVLVVAGLMAAGCGGGGGGGGGASNGVANESAQQILNSALTALKSASSVKIDGSSTQNGTATTLDAVLYSNGDIDGSIDLGGQTVQIVKVGGTDYLMASADFWTTEGLPAATASKLAANWVSVPDSEAKVGSQFSITSFASTLDTNLGTLAVGSTSTIDGEPAISITSTTQGTLWVATTGAAYPLEATGNGTSSQFGSITLGDWNQGGTAPSAPAGAQPVSALVGGSGATGPSGAVTGPSGTGDSGTGAT